MASMEPYLGIEKGPRSIEVGIDEFSSPQYVILDLVMGPRRAMKKMH